MLEGPGMNRKSTLRLEMGVHVNSGLQLCKKFRHSSNSSFPKYPPLHPTGHGRGFPCV